jgi:hypothetical protein
VVQLYADLSAGFEGMIAENKLRQQDNDGAAAQAPPSQAEEAGSPGAVQAPEPESPAQADASVPVFVSEPAPAALLR